MAKTLDLKTEIDSNIQSSNENKKSLIPSKSLALLHPSKHTFE
jgi:hypothetical protein